MRAGVALAALVVAAAIALDGCGDDEPVAVEPPELIQVGVLPVANVAPLYLGMEKGFFGEVGLRIRPIVTSGGTAIVAPVVAGDFEMGVADTVSVLQSASRGEPLEIVAQGGLGGRSARQSWAKLVALPDGPVHSVADLAGRTVAVNRLGGISEVTVKASLERSGVDPDAVTFAIVPLDQMIAALQAGRVQAIAAVEPLVTAAEDAKAVGIDDFYTRTAPDLTVAAYITSRQFATEEPATVERFVQAVNRSLTYAEANPDEVRAILPTYMSITPEAAQRITLPLWRTDITTATVRELGRLSERYGVLRSMPSLTRLVRTTP